MAEPDHETETARVAIQGEVVKPTATAACFGPIGGRTERLCDGWVQPPFPPPLFPLFFALQLDTDSCLPLDEKTLLTTVRPPLLPFFFSLM